MKIQVKTYSDIDPCINEIVYYIKHGDYDKMYSNRGQVIQQARSLMEPCYVHLWMIMYPLEGQELTVNKNISDLAGWIEQIASKCKGKIPMHDVYVELAEHYLVHVRSELQKYHGYPDLKGQMGYEISQAMNDILAAVQFDIVKGKKQNKNYISSRQTIIDLIKYVLDLN